jgi:hyperosmotically inducible periplasmic protein
MHARTICSTLLPALLAAATVFAGDRRDARVADDIARSLNTHPQLTIFDHVSAQVENGVVTLTGKVTADYKRNDVARVLSRVEGVRDVRNGVSVLPPSPFDDELRYRAARAIYGHSAFWSYASMARPPIHIIVENGRVTLTGVVASDVERALARSLTTGIGELSVSNELRTEIAQVSARRP